MPSYLKDHPRRSATPTRPSGDATGYAHPRCYARGLNDCSKKISREHYISRNVLELLGGSAETSGFQWLNGNEVSLPADALASKILCERHNSALSPLDAATGHLFGTLRNIDAALADDAPPSTTETYVVNGPDIQRWLLKCLIGLTSSGSVQPPALREHDYCVRILFGEATWKPGWGLYLSPGPISQAYNGLSVAILNGQDGTTWGARFNIAGLRFVLSLGRAAGDTVYFRPAGAEFNHLARPAIKTVAFAWTRPPQSGYTRFTRSAPYGGEPIDRY
jgi:hypothetical protein